MNFVLLNFNEVNAIENGKIILLFDFLKLSFAP